MSRQRVNPFDQGTPERTLYERYRKDMAQAQQLAQEAAVAMTAARAHRASADRYADALRALGHGDKVEGQAALPDYSRLAEAS